MGADGVLQRSEPFVDDAIVLRLDQKLGALPSLQLQEKPPVLETLTLKIKAFRRSCRRRLTSRTCFLLDLSLDAHSTAPPLRSTVNSGLD